ncbi:ABC transporter ATP-binding protein [Devosia sp.]|uniref:ABC transporter ATP-binding protein n=1 Tax=Devosia sp. TaxID=1871048 RepID=UPI003BA8E8A2
MSLLEVEELVMEYRGGRKVSRPLDAASLSVSAGEIVAIVGESGSGKSTLAAAIGRLPIPGLLLVSGTVSIDGTDVATHDEPGLKRLRQETIGYIFQDPVATLDPTMKIGRQLAVALGGGRAEALQALEGLGLRDLDRVLASYPHQISGGMAQRVAIGLALARRPKLIIADEPTAALDASVKRTVLELLVRACHARGSALLLVTHDLHAVQQHAASVAVMYGGRVIERGMTADVLGHPVHPYTTALMDAAVGRERPGERVEPIPGMPPQLMARAEFCAFAPRCGHATDLCRTERPMPQLPHDAACHYADSLAVEDTE